MKALDQDATKAICDRFNAVGVRFDGEGVPCSLIVDTMTSYDHDLFEGVSLKVDDTNLIALTPYNQELKDELSQLV